MIECLFDDMDHFHIITHSKICSFFYLEKVRKKKLLACELIPAKCWPIQHGGMGGKGKVILLCELFLKLQIKLLEENIWISSFALNQFVGESQVLWPCFDQPLHQNWFPQIMKINHFVVFPSSFIECSSIHASVHSKLCIQNYAYNEIKK